MATNIDTPNKPLAGQAAELSQKLAEDFLKHTPQEAAPTPPGQNNTPPGQSPTNTPNAVSGSANAAGGGLQNGDAANTSQTTAASGPRKISINDFLSGNSDLGGFLDSYIKEEREKQQDYKAQEKKYKRDRIYNSIGDAVMALSNMLFTSMGAPNMFDPKNTMSGRARERYDKMVAERDKGRDNIIRLAQIKESLRQNDNNVKLAIEQFNQQAEQNAFNQDMARQQMDLNKDNAQWQKQMEQDKFDFNKQTTEWQQGHADEQLALQEKGLQQQNEHFHATQNLENRKFEWQKQQGSVTFALGGGETVSIPSQALNDETVNFLYSRVPYGWKENVRGKPIITRDAMGNQVQAKDKNGKPLYYAPDNSDMLGVIAEYLSYGGSEGEDMRRQLRILAGQTPSLGVSSSGVSLGVSLGVGK